MKARWKVAIVAAALVVAYYALVLTAHGHAVHGHTIGH